MKNLPVPSGAEDEKLCKVVVDGSIAFGGGSQVSSITSEIFLSSVYRIAKKVSQGTSDTSTVIEDYALNAKRPRRKDVFGLVIYKYGVLSGDLCFFEYMVIEIEVWLAHTSIA